MTAAAATRPQPVVHRVLRVVLVDDTPDIRLLMRIALERVGGFQVVGEAGDGIEAIREARGARPDVIVMDLAMPRMGGLEALPQLRELCPTATILVLSGFEDASLGPLAVQAGADGYVRKGATPQEIVTRIHSLRTGAELLEAPAPAPEPLGLPAAALLDAPFAVLEGSTDAHGERWVSGANAAARRFVGPGDLPARLATLAGPVDAAVAEIVAGAGATTARTTLGGEPVSVWRTGGPDRFTLVLTPEPTTGTAPAHEPGGTDEADRLRRVFAAAAHEMRNPVTVLVGATQTLGSGRDDLPPEVRDRLYDAVRRQARALERSTADLLAASRAGVGKLTVDPRPVPLLPLVRACVEDWSAGSDVVLDGPRDLEVLADPGRLEQMLVNLLGNAVKYGEPPVWVTIAAEGAGEAGHGGHAGHAGQMVRIDVHDCGPGVSAEFAPHLFEEFSRQRGTHVQGTGLGLYVVRALARAQGGDAGYEHVEGRSTFWVTVPVADEGREAR